MPRASTPAPSAAPRARALYIAEPPGLWQVRPPLVVDCNVLAAHLFEEAGADRAAAALRGRALHAPWLLPFEFANVARNKTRSGGSLPRVEAALSTFSELHIDLHAVPVLDLHRLASRYELSAYDAAYLWLAAALRAPLVTFDAKLQKAAQHHLPTLE